MSVHNYNHVKNSVAVQRGKNLVGVALIQALSVTETGLSVVPEETNYKWHADIANWPDCKEERKSIAQQLATKATVE